MPKFKIIRFDKILVCTKTILEIEAENYCQACESDCESAYDCAAKILSKEEWNREWKNGWIDDVEEIKTPDITSGETLPGND